MEAVTINIHVMWSLRIIAGLLITYKQLLSLFFPEFHHNQQKPTRKQEKTEKPTKNTNKIKSF